MGQICSNCKKNEDIEEEAESDSSESSIDNKLNNKNNILTSQTLEIQNNPTDIIIKTDT